VLGQDSRSQSISGEDFENIFEKIRTRRPGPLSKLNRLHSCNYLIKKSLTLSLSPHTHIWIRSNVICSYSAADYPPLGQPRRGGARRRRGLPLPQKELPEPSRAALVQQKRESALGMMKMEKAARRMETLTSRAKPAVLPSCSSQCHLSPPFGERRGFCPTERMDQALRDI
jgi:hypothetical protein